MGCNTNNIVSFGNPGKNGASSYIYIAYADDVVSGTPDIVTNFLYGIPDPISTRWMAVKNSTTPITNPVESDFQGLWVHVAGVGINPDTNVYNTDGTFTGNRTVDADGYTFNINNLAGFTINGLFYPILDGSTGQVLVTDGAGNLVFTDASNIYSSNGSLTSSRIVNGNGFNLSIGNNTMPHFYINVTDSFEVNATTLINLATYTFQTSSTFNNQFGAYGAYEFTNSTKVGQKNNTDTIHARIEFNNGVMYIQATDHIEIYQNGVLIYKLPTTKPTTGQKLTALDNAGTLGWS